MADSYEIRNAFTVPFEYRVHFSDHLLDADNPLLAQVLMPSAGSAVARAVVFIDQTLLHANPALTNDVRGYFYAHRGRLTLAADVLVMPGGEQAKRDAAVFDRCVLALRDAKLDRHSYAVMIGGGAMLDAVGFAASTVHRGVRQVRIPTTVLAQNDAGIGVKNGIDYQGQKNFLGSFYPPYAVLNDYTLLATLPLTARRDGHAEAVKVGLIRDAAFYAWVEQHAPALASGEEAATRYAIRRCAELHLQHIGSAGDPFERGSARPLDFGHWAAHKLEQLSHFRISHGHAVAVGMAIDVLYSSRMGLLADADARRIHQCLQRLGFTFDVAGLAGLKSRDDLPLLLEGIAEFQEHLGGQLCVTMLRQIGVGVELNTLDTGLLAECCANVLL